jgi:hypothetical protein
MQENAEVLGGGGVSEADLILQSTGVITNSEYTISPPMTTTGLGTKPNVQDVAIFDDVLFAFELELAGGF